MSETTEKEQHEHCWHGAGSVLLCNPPAYPEVCCHCGAKRTRHAEQPKVPEGHGPHHPNAPLHTYFSFSDD